VPETNTRPAARTAWLYVGGGDGALGVRMMSLAINFSSADWKTRMRYPRPDLIHICKNKRRPIGHSHPVKRGTPNAHCTRGPAGISRRSPG
jgi:hypothetical protein